MKAIRYWVPTTLCAIGLILIVVSIVSIFFYNMFWHVFHVGGVTLVHGILISIFGIMLAVGSYLWQWHHLEVGDK